MNESDKLEMELKQTMQARWDGVRPSPQMEAAVLQKIGAQRSHKRRKQTFVAFVLSGVAISVVVLIFVVPVVLQKYPGTFPMVALPTSETTLFTSFECPTAEPPPLTRGVAPTIAPVPTTNPNTTPRPTRVKKIKTPRPAGLPTPTIEYLSVNGKWKTYSEPRYGFSFEYPDTWFLQSSESVPDPRFGAPSLDASVNLWNFSPDQYMALLDPTVDSMAISVSLYPTFCDFATLQDVADQPVRAEEFSALTPRAPIGSYPAWQRTIRFPYTAPNRAIRKDGIQLFVPRGTWLYSFSANPANSTQIAAFEHLLETFQSP